MCFCRGSKELTRICEFLNERIEECVLSSRGSTLSNYKYYLTVLLEIVLSSGDHLAMIFDAIMPNLLNKVADYKIDPYDINQVCLFVRLMTRDMFNQYRTRFSNRLSFSDCVCIPFFRVKLQQADMDRQMLSSCILCSNFYIKCRHMATKDTKL